MYQDSLLMLAEEGSRQIGGNLPFIACGIG